MTHTCFADPRTVVRNTLGLPATSSERAVIDALTRCRLRSELRRLAILLDVEPGSPIDDLVSAYRHCGDDNEVAS